MLWHSVGPRDNISYLGRPVRPTMQPLSTAAVTNTAELTTLTADVNTCTCVLSDVSLFMLRREPSHKAQTLNALCARRFPLLCFLSYLCDFLMFSNIPRFFPDINRGSIISSTDGQVPNSKLMTLISNLLDEVNISPSFKRRRRSLNTWTHPCQRLYSSLASERINS